MTDSDILTKVQRFFVDGEGDVPSREELQRAITCVLVTNAVCGTIDRHEAAMTAITDFAVGPAKERPPARDVEDPPPMQFLRDGRALGVGLLQGMFFAALVFVLGFIAVAVSFVASR